MNEIIPNILNEDLLANVEPQQGWVWFIALFVGIGAFFYGLIDCIFKNCGCCGDDDDDDDNKKKSTNPSPNLPTKSICILGQKESGKTTLYNWLKEDKFIPGDSQTSSDEYEEFVFRGKIKIAKGRDIGGIESYVYDYGKMIKNTENCVFVFDVNKFLDDSKYRQETWFRAELINRKCNEFGKKRFTIGTHLDKTSFASESDKAISRVQELSVKKTNFIDMFKSNFVVTDLTTKQGFEKCVKYLLKK